MARLASASVVALAVVWSLPRALAVRVGDDEQPFHDNASNANAASGEVVFLSCVLNLSMSLNSVGKAKSRAQTTMYRRYWKRVPTKPEGGLLHSLGRVGHLFC
eukprot:TRINITY_DN10983_c0_g1_i2.p1 TRINITY_DN10983_c0_g1~~TRINITY_DN10983_c0_g1_i2.p1  ORF type:complete len:103 (-),score=20.04 TRINITY_DN10983_c0_g1_i2:131-439(-)